jgi:type IV fimbrial biogenesis protein FimT
MRARRKPGGFTLLELLITLSIVAILLGLAIPSIGNLLAEARLRGHSSELSLALARARMRAVDLGKSVSVCPNDGSGQCRPGRDWSRGWVILDDPNADGVAAPGVQAESVFNVPAGDARISSTAGRPFVTYLADGSSAGSNVTLTLCDPEGRARPRQVIVNNVGRVRSAGLASSVGCPSP